MAEHEFDLVVIGGGPGGYTAAIRAAQLGLSVACIEREPDLGGTCLRVGCIPSKALLESSHHYEAVQHDLAGHGVITSGLQLDLATMMQRKHKAVKQLAGGISHLLKKNKIARYLGHGRIDGPGRVVVGTNEGDVALTARTILIATGSEVSPLRGVELDGDRIGTSTEALSYPEVPRRLVVIGAGVIGLELGSVWRRLGSEVVVLEYLDRIMPEMDAELAAEAQKIFTKQGIIFQLGSRVVGARTEGQRCLVECDGAEPIEADRVLLCVGRRPCIGGLGLESVGIQPDERGRIPVDDSFRTTAAGILAIGDCIRGPMLAHKAQEEGVAAVETLVTGYGHVNYNAIPSVVYTEPEIASVGKTEEELKQQGVRYRKGVFPYMANGRAVVLGHTEGRVKVLADSETDRILGVHIIGSRAGDLIAEAAVAIEFGASSEDLGRAIHAHPTMAEIVKEASLAVDNRATYI